MRFISAIQKRITPAQHYTVLVNNEPTDPEVLKARLAEQLPPHDSSSFQQLISDYLTDDLKPDLGLLVRECMKNGDGNVLAYILATEDIESLCIEGPIHERELKTLAKAMPDVLPVKELKLSGVFLNASMCGILLNNVLGRMPALERLALRNVRAKRSQQSCPDLPLLADLEVSGHSKPKVGVYPLLRGILEASQVRRLSIDVSGAITVRQHSKLAALLCNQIRMHSLRLRIKHRATPEEFECYMPFLCSKTTLVELDLSGCCIQASNFNQLIEALSNQSALESLFLSGCSVVDDPTHRRTGLINVLPLAKIKSLKHLDLSSNHLPKGKTVALLAALKKEATLLVTLNLSRNPIGSHTISEVASLLQENETLQRLSFENSMLQGDLDITLAMLELVQAIEHNKSLVELQFRWNRDLDEYRASVDASLDRNKQAAQRAFMQAAMQTAATFVPLLLNRSWTEEALRIPQLPGEMIQLVEQELTSHDALTLSSLDRETRKSHEEFLRKAGS